jgi:hypothetical protein
MGGAQGAGVTGPSFPLSCLSPRFPGTAAQLPGSVPPPTLRSLKARSRSASASSSWSQAHFGVPGAGRQQTWCPHLRRRTRAAAPRITPARPSPTPTADRTTLATARISTGDLRAASRIRAPRIGRINRRGWVRDSGALPPPPILNVPAWVR